MKLAALARSDLRHLARDPLLVIAALAPLPIAFAARFGAAPLLAAVGGWVDASVVRAWIGTLVLVLPPLLLGSASAFLVLEERDAGVLPAVAVTPAGLDGLLRWRLAAPTALALLAACAAWPGAGMDGALTTVIPASLAAALWAPVTALVLIRFARDRIQGMALSKVCAVTLLLPGALWLPPDVALIAAAAPPFWIARALWRGSSLDALAAVGVALLWALVALASPPARRDRGGDRIRG